MTSTMRKRRGLKLTAAPEACSRKQQNIRRETFITVPSSQLPQMEEEEEEEADLRTPARLDSAQDAPLLQTNGKLPMWFRKLGQGGASSGVQSDAEPRQVRSRWAEQPNPLTICSVISPCPTKSQEEEEEQREEEEEEDFHPQSLESLLGEDEEEEEGEEEEEVLQNPGEDRSRYNTNNTTTDRDFDVEGVTDPRRTQLEVRGQGAEPVWSTQLSPDSAYSEDLAGSLEQQHDADTDSLSQGSSVGSLCLEDDEDRNSLKNHFDTLASGLNDEKFDTDLRTLQPPEEKPFLNSRLSISTRFLSRFQDRIRLWPSRVPPPVSIPTRISEESNVSSTSVNSELSSEVTSTESTQKENNNNNNSGDVTSRTLVAQNSSVVSAVQQGAPRVGYLGTTASSRAKLSQDTANSSTTSSTSTQEEEKENLSSSDLQPPAPLLSAGLDLHSTKPDPHQDQTSSVALMSQKSQHHVVLATPTEVMSLGEDRKWSVSSVEETLTNLNQTLILSPAPSITPTPTACDITSDITCSASRQEEGPGGSETRIQTDPDTSLGADPPTSSSSPLLETLHPPQTGSGDVTESVSVQQCQQVANELRQTARRAVHLYQQLSASAGGSERRLQMSSVLQEAFDVVHSELQEVLRRGDGRGGGGGPSGRLEDGGTTSLLEKYSELLVQMTQNKLNRI